MRERRQERKVRQLQESSEAQRKRRCVAGSPGTVVQSEGLSRDVCGGVRGAPENLPKPKDSPISFGPVRAQVGEKKYMAGMAAGLRDGTEARGNDKPEERGRSQTRCRE